MALLAAAGLHAQETVAGSDGEAGLDEADLLAPAWRTAAFEALGAPPPTDLGGWLERYAALAPPERGLWLDLAVLPAAGDLAPDVRLRLAQRLLDHGDAGDLEAVSRLLEAPPPLELAPAWNLALGRTYRAGADTVAASDALLRAFPQRADTTGTAPDGWCAAAEALLASAPAPDLSPWVDAACHDLAPTDGDLEELSQARLWLGTTRYRRGDDAHAREVLAALADSPVAPLEPRCAAAAQLGRAEERTGSDARALERYAWVLSECPLGSDPHHRARFGSGRVCVRERDRACAELHLEALQREYPDHTTVDDALFHLADLYRLLGDDAAWRATVEASLALSGDGDMWRETVWRRARHLWSEGDAAAASELMVRALGRFAWDATYYSQGRFEYMLGRIAIEQALADEAAGWFERGLATYPLTFYAAQSCRQLEDLGRDCGWPARERPIEPARWALGGCVPAQGRWLALAEAGRFEAAAEALAALPADCDEGLWIQALLWDLADRPDLAHEIPRRRLGGWARLVGPEYDRRFALAYPTPFAGRVREEAARTGLEPALIWAVMREESGFRAPVHSYAGAQGLMQLMPRTAAGHVEGVEGELTPERLLEPDVNIRIGANFLAHLGRHLDGNPLLMVAAYNAGRGAVSRWLRERPLEDAGLWIEAVGPTQTRDYTKRVLTSVEVYRYLYR